MQVVVPTTAVCPSGQVSVCASAGCAMTAAAAMAGIIAAQIFPQILRGGRVETGANALARRCAALKNAARVFNPPKGIEAASMQLKARNVHAADYIANPPP